MQAKKQSKLEVRDLTPKNKPIRELVEDQLALITGGMALDVVVGDAVSQGGTCSDSCDCDQ